MRRADEAHAARHQNRRGGRRARRNQRRDPRGALPRHRRHRHGDPHSRNRQGDSAALLRRDREAFVLFGLLERRPTGLDGSAALSRRLRRHRRRGACTRLRGAGRTVRQGRAGGVPRSTQPVGADVRARDIEVGRGADRREVRCRRWSQGRPPGGPAAVQRRRR